jgi:hypothetical protein
MRLKPHFNDNLKKMKEKIYYLILIFLILSSLTICYLFDLNFKYWIGIIGILVLFIWCKDEFTGKKWFEKTQTEPTKYNSPLTTMSDTEYEQFVDRNYPLISEQEKLGFISLTKLCLAQQKQNELIDFFETLKDFSKDEDYMTTLNYVMEYCDKRELFFIMALDWKQDIETLEWRLKNSLTKNFNFFIDLPKAENYEERVSVSYDNVFEDFDKPLRNQGLQMGFIDTQSDQYVIFVHRMSDIEKIEKAVSEIGYKYHEK